MRGSVRGFSCGPNIYVFSSTSELSVRLVRCETGLSPTVKKVLLIVPRRYFFCGSFVLFMSCVCNAFASVLCCFVIT